MAELADAEDSKSSARKSLRVQFPPGAPNMERWLSGLKRLLRRQETGFPRSWVQIPPSPPIQLNIFIYYGEMAERL